MCVFGVFLAESKSLLTDYFLRELIGALRAASLDVTAYFFSDNLLMFIHCITIMYVLQK